MYKLFKSRFCEEQARWSESSARGLQVYDVYINCLGDFCQLLTFTNSLDLHVDQTQQKVSRDQYPNRLTLCVHGLKSLSSYRGKQCRPCRVVLIVCFQ